MNLMRLFTGLVVALCLLLMLLFSLLFTQLGNQWLWGLAKQQVPGLDGTLVSGQFGRGWQFDELSYEQDSLAFSARQVTIDWQLGKLLERRFWLHQLVAEDIDVTIKTLPPAKEEAPTEPLGQITPPLRIDLDEIRADRVTISLPGQTIAWQSLQLAAHWDADAMVITGPNLDGLTLTLTPAEAVAASNDKAVAAATSPLTLPEVVLPFPVKLQDLSLTNSRLIQSAILKLMSAQVVWTALIGRRL